jgi:uncharacterized membrane-anchored protein
MQDNQLSFALIEEKVAQYAKSEDEDQPGLVERIAMAFGIFLWLLLMLAYAFIKTSFVLALFPIIPWVGTIAVASMLIGFLIFLWRERPTFICRGGQLD